VLHLQKILFSLLTDIKDICGSVHKAILKPFFLGMTPFHLDSLKFPDINNINMTFLQPSETEGTVLLCYTALLENVPSTARR